MNSTVNQVSKEDTQKTLKTIAYYTAFVALGMTSASLGPTLPALAAHTQTHLSEASILFTARSLGYLLGSLRGGRLFDRMPGHRVQAMALSFMAIMLLLVPTLPSLWVLGVVLVLLGIGEGTLDVGGNTLLVWVHKEKVGPFMNGLHFFFGIGAFLSPVIIAQALLLTGDITWAYWVLALVLIPVIFLVSRVPSPSIAAGSNADQPGSVNFGLVLLIMTFFFLNVGAEGSFGGWIFSYAKAQNLANEVNAAYLTSAFWGGLTVGRLLAIPIAARVHPRWILLGDLLGCLASLSLILFWQNSFTGVWLGSCGMGLFMASVFPTTITLSNRYLPINGRITGWFFVGASAGSMFFPWLIGQLFEPVGPQISMIVILAAVVSSLVVFGILMFQFKRSVVK